MPNEVRSNGRGFRLWIAVVGMTLTACAPEAEEAARPAEPAATPAAAKVEVAQGLTLPELTACDPTTHPTLPAKWGAVGLLEGFTKQQLVVGQMVYDASVPAFRATLHGLENGSADLLVTDSTTYLLYGSAETPTGCYDLGATGWKPPAQDWLGSDAVCAGEAPLQQQGVQWWKTKATGWTPQDPATTWFWYTDQDRLPWRTMFASPSAAPAVIGSFSMTYFPSFAALESTGLPALVQMCSGAKPFPGAKQGAMPDIQALLARADQPAGSRGRAEALIPGLSLAACQQHPLPQWPQQLGMTTFMTPVNFEYDPFPTEVLYQWSVQSQRTRMFQPPSSQNFSEDALLIQGTGYDIYRQRSGGDTCSADLPGVPVPNWPSTDQCSCMGVLENNPQLSPNETAMILNCSMVPPRVFWTWYTPQGRPIVFMETNSPADEGTGLALADYYSWQPGTSIPPGTFNVPSNCSSTSSNAPTAERFHHGTQDWRGLRAAGSPSATAVQASPCNNCHMPLNTGLQPAAAQ